jgi:FMN phosphatase YigB (HAD superfamily)
VLEHYRVPPREIIYFDDIPAYVAAARALGIQAVQFESARQVTEVLAGFKVSPA